MFIDVKYILKCTPQQRISWTHLVCLWSCNATSIVHMFTANSSVTLDVTRLTLSFSIPLGPLVQTQVSVLLCIQSLYLERNFWSSVPLVQWAYASARPPCQMAISIMRKKDRLFTSRRKTRSWFLFQRQCLDPKMVVPLLAMVTTRIHCLPS